MRWTRALLATLVVVLMVIPGVAIAKVSDPWRDIASVSGLTSGATATRLADGNVLVVGGDQPFAKVYQVQTNTWRTIAPMLYPRLGHSAVLLNNGKVLVVGGLGTDFTTHPAPELYDPARNRWSLAAPTIQARTFNTLTLLTSGRVLLVGGGDVGCSTPEIYTPWTNSWQLQPTAFNLDKCNGHVAVRMLNSRVLFHGGFDSQGAGFNPSIEYRPGTGTWFGPIASSPVRQSDSMSMILLGTGKVLLVGGTCRLCTGGSNLTWLYDPATSSWSATGNMTYFRISNMLAPLSGNRALVAGSGDVDEIGTSSNPQSAEIYSAATGTWTQIANMHYDTHSIAVPLLNGQVLLLGGPVGELYVGG